MATYRRSSSGIVVVDDDMHPVIQVIVWILLAMMSLMLAFRFLTRFFLKSNRVFGVEEIFIIVSFTFAVGQSITMLVPQAQAVGKDFWAVSLDDRSASQKALYAGDMLFIVSLLFSKWSVCASFIGLTPDEKHRRATYAISVVALLWALASLFGDAFRCGIHGIWEQRQLTCINKIAFQHYSIIGNIVTDVCLVLLPVGIILPLQMPLKTRITVIAFFSARLTYEVILAAAFQLSYVHTLTDPDFSRSAFPYFVALQFVLFTSVSSSCIAYFWPFLRSLRSGLMWASSTTFTTQYTLSKLSNQTKPSSWQEHKEGVSLEPLGQNSRT